jgi:Fic family protein
VTEEPLNTLSEGELAAIDAQYRPYPPFIEWPTKVPELTNWDLAVDEFEEVATAATDLDLERAREIALRAAAFDTGAIEGLYSTNRGLTFTVAEQLTAWEQQVEAQGKDARALFEAQLRALELVLDQVTDRLPEVTQAWIRRIHEETTAPQNTYVVHTAVGSQGQPLPKGEYKQHPNHVRSEDGKIHAYAPVGDTQAEMERLVQELGSEEFSSAHPLVQAAYAHYALVTIHPFADGNGRVARALASVYTYRAASIPFLVLNEERDSYFSALAAADQGDASRFLAFVAGVETEAISLVLDGLRTARAPQPEHVLEQFNELYRREEREKELDQIAVDLAEWLDQAVRQRVNALDTPGNIELTVEDLDENLRDLPPPGTRRSHAQGIHSVRILFKSLPPVAAEEVRRINVFVATDPPGVEAILLQVVQTPDECLFVSLSDLRPRLSAIAQHRVENFIHRVLGSGLQALHAQVTE